MTSDALASHALSDRGLSFHDVVRTWIYLRDIERDYSEFNQGRRQFFQAAGGLTSRQHRHRGRR